LTFQCSLLAEFVEVFLPLPSFFLRGAEDENTIDQDRLLPIAEFPDQPEEIYQTLCITLTQLRLGGLQTPFLCFWVNKMFHRNQGNETQQNKKAAVLSQKNIFSQNHIE
jgi:hypothetical protein